MDNLSTSNRENGISKYAAWEPKVTLDVGLQKTIEYFRS